MTAANIAQIIELKSQGSELNTNHIEHFVKSVFKNEIDDAQIGAFLMAVKLKGMNYRETADLTKSMAECSKQFDWSIYKWSNKVVDKHSTGGVGDKISHILAPILSACGLKMPMISGRGLGITGGTIDKLEAIKGFSVVDDLKVMPGILENAGFFITGQTETMVPVDKRLYAIRDVTATVDSVPLITASILSKKRIEDIRVLLMDVKFGKGTFMKTKDEADKLAKSIIETGKSMNMNIVCLVDDMNSPLGCCIGNALEIAEVLRALNGEMIPDIKEVIYTMAEELLKYTEINLTTEDITTKIDEVIKNGNALKKFQQMLVSQGVSEELANKLCVHEVLPIKTYMEILDFKNLKETEIPAEKTGYITSVNAEIVGNITRDLGGGRKRKEDKLNYGVGIQLICKEGDFVEQGKIWAKIYHESELEPTLIKSLQLAVKVESMKPQINIRVKDILRSIHFEN